MIERIKVAYICHFSNMAIRSQLPKKVVFFKRISLAKNHLPQTVDVPDFAVWNTNCINELKKYTDRIELHVIAPYRYLKPKTFTFMEDGIHYHFFRSDDDNPFYVFFRRLFHISCSYKRNRKIVKSIISKIEPNLVHCVGAENPYYSMSALDVPTDIPLLVQLQTLMSDPDYENKTSVSHLSYVYRSEIEKKIIKRADYIGFAGKHYIEIIKDKIKSNAVFVKTVLALAEPVNISVGEKKYDFVYFSNDISKAADLAIEAFILTSQSHPNLTLNIVGGYSHNYKAQLEERLVKAGVRDNVVFSGKLPSHEDVIKQIRLSHFALLPLKIDIISGTIREALANGLPVVTTITVGTPMLNEKRRTVLLSEIGDHQALADNMCKLIEDPTLCEEMRKNGGIYMNEKDSNELRVKRYVDIYFALCNNFYCGTKINPDLLS